MPDLIRDSFESFHSNLKRSYQSLQSIQKDIEDRKSKILEALDAVAVPVAPTGNSPFQKECRNALQKMGGQIEVWKRDLQSMIEKSEFVNRHEKSLLVIVFADVKAGKSTLGNFVSGYYLQDTPYADLHTPMNYAIEDYSAASLEDRSVRELPLPFPENEIEATSAIQYYTLGQGLTWVDTPGLHSLTKEHGELAKEYIQFADLVLFLTSSASPLKEDEQITLGELLNQGKAVMVVLSRSDIPKKVTQNGKIIQLTLPKPSERREAQEKHVMEIIRKFSGKVGIENGSAVSISTKLARQAVAEGDQEKFRGSNLDVFFSQMGEILSERAIELKMRRPKTEVNHCVDRIIGSSAGEDGQSSVRQQHELIQKWLQELETFSESQEKLVKEIILDMEGMLPNALSGKLRNLRAQKKLDDAQAVRQEIGQCITETCATVCVRKCREKFQVSQLHFDGPAAEVSNQAGYGYEETYIDIDHTTQVERNPKGLEHIVHFFARDKKFYSTETSTESISIGDNYQQFIEKNWQAVRPDMEQYVHIVVELLFKQYIEPLRKSYQNLYDELTALGNRLEEIKYTE